VNSRAVHNVSRDSLGGRETPGEVPNRISGKHAAGEEKKSEGACMQHSAARPSRHARLQEKLRSMNRKNERERLSNSKLIKTCISGSVSLQVTYKMFGLLLEQRRIQRDIMRRLETPSSSDME